MVQGDEIGAFAGFDGAADVIEAEQGEYRLMRPSGRGLRRRRRGGSNRTASSMLITEPAMLLSVCGAAVFHADGFAPDVVITCPFPPWRWHRWIKLILPPLSSSTASEA